MPTAINEPLDNNTNDKNNDFFNHIFGKQKKVQQNEVELYLNATRADPQQDILLWWKVSIFN